MITIRIDGIHDIDVDICGDTAAIDIKTERGQETTRIEMHRMDAELLSERLTGALNKV
jgi:stress-induced morphogen